MLVDYSRVRIFIYNVHLTAGGIVGPKVSLMNFSAFEAAGFTGFGDNIQTWDPKNSLNIDGIHKHCPSQCIDHILFNDKIKNLFANSTTQLIFNRRDVLTRKGMVSVSDHYGILSELKI